MIRSIAALGVLATATALVPAPAWAIDPPRYVDEAATAGIDHAYRGGWEFYVGGGVAVFDCSGDGYPELYFAGGTDPAALYRNRSSQGGALRFEPVQGQPHLTLTGVTGAYPLDLDGDDRIDLAVLRVGENVLLRGLGDCRFEVANGPLAFDGGQAWTTAFSATWEAGADLPTLAFGNYVDRAAPGAPYGTCHDNDLYRPDGDGYGARRLLRPSYCTLSLLFSDWNRDQVPDLRVSNDRQYYLGGAEQLWSLRPGISPRPAGRAEGWRELKIWGMGIASYDLTGTGLPDYFLTSMADNKLQTLEPPSFGQPLRPAFRDIAFQLGATLHRPYTDGEIMPSTAWHAEFDDVNNDGLIDLFVAKGNVEGMIDFARRDPNNLVLGQPDGTFREAAPDAGIVTFERARGGAVSDLNLDGLLDLVVVNREAPAELWRNAGSTLTGGGPMGNWAMIRLRQPGFNRHAVSSWIEVKSGTHIWRRELTVGGGHAGGEFGWVHFGVGTAERIEIRVQWPDGQWGPWVRAFTNQFILVDRRSETPFYWYPETAAAG